MLVSKQASHFSFSCAERPDSSASTHGRTAVGASAFDILPTRGVLEAGQTCTVEFAYYARPGQKASATAVCDVEGGPTYSLPVSADSNAIKYRPWTLCMPRHAVLLNSVADMHAHETCCSRLWCFLNIVTSLLSIMFCNRVILWQTCTCVDSSC